MADIINLTERLQSQNKEQLELQRYDIDNSQLALKQGMDANDTLVEILKTAQRIEDVVRDQFSWFQKNALAQEDAAREGRGGRMTGGSVAGVDPLKNLKDYLKNFDMGLFGKMLLAALALWTLDLEDYVRAVLLPNTIKIFKSISDSIKQFGGRFKTKVLGIVDDVWRIIRSIIAPIEKLAIKVKNVISERISKLPFTGGTAAAAQPFENLLNRNSLSSSLSKTMFGDIVKDTAPNAPASAPQRPGLISRVRTGVSNVASSVSGAVSTVQNSDYIKNITEAFKKANNIKSFIGDIGNFLNKIIGPIKSFFTVVRTVVSKILLPLQVLFSLFDFVQGFIEGFKTRGEEDTRGMMEKIFDGIIGGFREMITSFFGGILDLLKDLVGWIAEKLGFDQFSEMLDSFSFEEFFKNIWDGLMQLFSGIKDVVVGLLTLDKDQIFSGLGKINDVFKQIYGRVWNGIISGLQMLLKKFPKVGEWAAKKLEKYKMDIPEIATAGESGGSGGGSPAVDEVDSSKMYDVDSNGRLVSNGKVVSAEFDRPAGYSTGGRLDSGSREMQDNRGKVPPVVVAPQNNSVNSSSVTNVNNTSFAPAARPQHYSPLPGGSNSW